MEKNILLSYLGAPEIYCDFISKNIPQNLLDIYRGIKNLEAHMKSTAYYCGGDLMLALIDNILFIGSSLMVLEKYEQTLKVNNNKKYLKVIEDIKQFRDYLSIQNIERFMCAVESFYPSIEKINTKKFSELNDEDYKNIIIYICMSFCRTKKTWK